MQRSASRWLLGAILGAATLLTSAPLLAARGLAQQDQPAETISGLVTDPSGAVVRGATVTLMRGGAAVSVTQSGPIGRYTLQADPGTYTIVVEAKGFARFESGPIEIGETHGAEPEHRPVTVDATLKIAARLEHIEVPEDSGGEGNRSGTTVVLSQSEVEQMPIDSQALLAELQALAGSPNAQVVVDGFTGSKLPPRDSIREIRINENPYSAENDTDTVSGVIQVLSKPGTNQLHGEAYLYGADSALNAQNPFIPNQPGYYESGVTGALSGSMSGKASFYAFIDRDRQSTNSAIDAETLDETLNPTTANEALPSPRSMLHALGREDLVNGRNTTVLRYTFDRTVQTNSGVGQLALASQGLDSTSLVHTLQATTTQVFSPAVVNETRLQYIRTRTQQMPVSAAPAIVVEGAFIGGGNNQGFQDEHKDRYEASNNLSLSKRSHYIEVGGRIRVGRDSIASEANFNGEFIFATLNSYETTLRGMAAGQTIAQIIAAGGGASQYSVTTGDPNASALIADGAAYAQDNWKARDNLKLSYGLRFEAQNYIAHRADFAPRVGFSWALGKTVKGAMPRYLIHGGGGLFYERFAVDSALDVERQNGIRQQQYVTLSPLLCPPSNVPSPGCTTLLSKTAAGTQSAETVYRISPNFRAPYFIEESIGVTRQLGTIATLGLTYLNSRGVHTQFTENANAPLPGTYSTANPSSGIRPTGANRNIYEYVSDGVYRSNRLMTTVSLRQKRVWASATYILGFSKSDAESNGIFPSNPYDLHSDYARSAADVRHSITVADDVSLVSGIRVFTHLTATSGAPFNIITGQDLNGDTQYNDRPAFATDLTRPSVVRTRWGAFDSNPLPDQTIIPRNYAEGPGLISMDLGAMRSIGFGPLKTADAPGTPVERRYTLEMRGQVINLLNHQNLASPIAVVNSPLFGHSVGLVGGSSLSPDRSIDLQVCLKF